MQRFEHNDHGYGVEAAGTAWKVLRLDGEGAAAVVGCGLFEGAGPEEAAERARHLVARLDPVGVRIVPPNVSRPQAAGDLKIVPPDVARPVFVGWQADSTRFSGVRNAGQE